MQKTPLEHVFDVEAFRHLGHQLIEALANHLHASRDANASVVLPYQPPERFLRQWGLDQLAGADAMQLVQRMLARATRLHSPRYVGHQVCAPAPLAVLFQCLAALLNNSASVYEMGQVACATEHALIAWMCRRFGMGPHADGVLTSGGSLGNLTALLAARQVMCQAMDGYDAWSQGTSPHPPPAILASRETHYSLQRAVRILGWGCDGIIPVETDAAYRMRPEALANALEAGRAKGRRVIGVAASACSTATGAYDPLEPIAAFCREHNLWLHVDAAHGGAAILSPRYAHLVHGIEHADSIVWDAHKMLMMPALCTAVLFKNGRHACQTFAQDASYLFERRAEEERYNMSYRSFECTKPSMSLPLYAFLAVYGEQPLSDHVTGCYDTTRAWAQRLHESPDFEVAHRPQANILCFRYKPQGARDLDQLQAAIRRRLIERGDFYIVQTKLPTGLHLRVSIMNPFTQEHDVSDLMKAIRVAASELNE